MARVDEVVKPPSFRWALAGLSLTMLMPSLDTSIANAALPSLAQGFAAPFQAVQWIVLAYLLAITVLIVSVGRLGDIVGRRRLLLAGISLFTAASVLCGLAPALWLLIAARAAQGLGAAVMVTLAMALARETVPAERTGSAMGLMGTMSAVGTTLGPSLGGLLIIGLGWRSIFLVNVPIGLVNLMLIWRHLQRDQPSPGAVRPGFDIVGSGILALTLAAYALAMTLGQGNFGRSNLALLAVAMIGAGVFLLVETKTASPLIRLGMFRNPALGAGLIMSVLVTTVMMATLVVGPFYLARAQGLDPAHIGLVISSGPLVAALTGVPAGRVVDRFGAWRMVVAGLSVATVGCGALAVMPDRLGVAGYAGAIAVVTGGYALFQAANNTSIMKGVGPEQRGVVAGMITLARNLGLVTGASVMGAVFALASNAGDVATASADAVVTGMRVSFAVSALLILTALIVAMAARPRI